MNPYLMYLLGFFDDLDRFDSDSDDSDMDDLDEYSVSDSHHDNDIASNDDIFESLDESDGGSGTAFSNEDEDELVNDDDGDDIENYDDDGDDLENYDDDDEENLENIDDDNEVDINDEELGNDDDDNERVSEQDTNQDEEINDTSTEQVQSIQENSFNESVNNRNQHSDNIVLSQVIENTRETRSVAIDTNSTQLLQMSLPSTSKAETLVRKTIIDESEAPPNKIRKLDAILDDDDDGETCPICLERWSNSGEHKLVSLKCGHLFGAACVERWLKAQPAKLRSCPTCKTKASIKEMRYIYARKLVAADNSEICSLQKELELTKADKNRMELECMQLKMTNRNFLLQLHELKSRMVPSKPNVVRHWSFALDKNVEICEGRVLTYNCRSYDLYVSQKSNNSLFPGYGVKKFNCVDYKFGNNILLHKKPIRDIAYNSSNDLLLSVSLDGTARIVERSIPCQATQPTDPYALWSCAWDETCQNKFYIGGTSGNLQQYDLRNLSQAVCSYNVSTDKSPVASICSTPYGLISCQLNSCWLWQSATEPVLLPVEGPFMSVAYESSLQKLLVACRPNRTERGRLLVCKFDQSESLGTQPACLIEKSFYGSSRASVLCRSAWVKVPETSWVASHSESDSSLYLYNMNNSRTVCIPASEAALDICNIQVNDDNMMATVSDFRLRIYKAVARS